MKIFRLLYISRCVSKDKFDAETMIFNISEHASKKNQTLGITGAITFDGNDFAQILEGDKDIVLKLFEKIKLDTRHDNIDLVKIQENTNRHYAAWGMKKLDSYNYDELITVMED